MDGKIRILLKEPGKKARFEYIDNELKAMQETVGGYIETVTLAEDVVIICDEEGRLKGAPKNCEVCGIDFVGPIFFAGIDGEELCDVPLDEYMAATIFPELMEEDA